MSALNRLWHSIWPCLPHIYFSAFDKMPSYSLKFSWMRSWYILSEYLRKDLPFVNHSSKATTWYVTKHIHIAILPYVSWPITTEEICPEGGRRPCTQWRVRNQSCISISYAEMLFGSASVLETIFSSSLLYLAISFGMDVLYSLSQTKNCWIFTKCKVLYNI